MTGLLLLGFLIGMRHALEADHVAAVASLATQTKSLRSAVLHGASWGLGHTATLFLFSSIVIFSESVIAEHYAIGLEFIVGVMLIGLGLDVLRRLIKQRIHFHSHHHGDDIYHFHAHQHQHDTQHDSENAHDHEHSPKLPVRPFCVGLIHGLAGSAALIVLTLQSVTSLTTGLLYILLFGFGSIIGMAALSFVIAIPLRQSAKGLTRLNFAIQSVFASFTLVIGVSLVSETIPALLTFQ